MKHARLVRADGSTAIVEEVSVITEHPRHESPYPDINGRQFAPTRVATVYRLDGSDEEVELMDGERIEAPWGYTFLPSGAVVDHRGAIKGA